MQNSKMGNSKILDKTSMLYWYPLISNLDIPQPRTEFVELTDIEKKLYHTSEDDGFVTERLVEETNKVIDEKFSLPVFLRTDYTSAKHGWKKTCYIEKTHDLEKNIFELTSFSINAGIIGIPCNALVVREYIPMDTLFNAFYGEMPVNPEMRFFIRNGDVECNHWYWVEDAIVKGKSDLPEDWRIILRKTHDEVISKDISFLEMQCAKVAERFSEDYFSVDFCKGKDSKWYLIDMAEGIKSFHPENCDKKK